LKVQQQYDHALLPRSSKQIIPSPTIKTRQSLGPKQNDKKVAPPEPRNSKRETQANTNIEKEFNKLEIQITTKESRQHK